MSCSPSMFRTKNSGVAAPVAAAPVWQDAPAPEGVPVLLLDELNILCVGIVKDGWVWTCWKETKLGFEITNYHYAKDDAKVRNECGYKFIGNEKWKPLS